MSSSSLPSLADEFEGTRVCMDGQWNECFALVPIPVIDVISERNEAGKPPPNKLIIINNFIIIRLPPPSFW